MNGKISDDFNGSSARPETRRMNRRFFNRIKKHDMTPSAADRELANTPSNLAAGKKSRR